MTEYNLADFKEWIKGQSIYKEYSTEEIWIGKIFPAIENVGGLENFSRGLEKNTMVTIRYPWAKLHFKRFKAHCEEEEAKKKNDNMDHTFENALKKLDRIEQNLNNQAGEITQKDKQITEKDNRNTQLHKLFHSTAKIFSKQHNYADQLKEKLKLEQQEKGISEEKAQHLTEDIQRLDQEKEELNKRIKELEEEQKKSEGERDRELQFLREQVKSLTANKEQAEKTHQDQLRQINLLYDPAARGYEKIDFDGLFELLEKEEEEKEQFRELIKKRDLDIMKLEAKVLTEKEIEFLDKTVDFNLEKEKYSGDNKRIIEAIDNLEREFREERIVEVGELTKKSFFDQFRTTTNFPHKPGKYSIYGILASMLTGWKYDKKVREDLQKELSWWDKWGRDNERKGGTFAMYKRRSEEEIKEMENSWLKISEENFIVYKVKEKYQYYRER